MDCSKLSWWRCIPSKKMALAQELELALERVAVLVVVLVVELVLEMGCHPPTLYKQQGRTLQLG